jgi:signal peptide peptidase SppA
MRMRRHLRGMFGILEGPPRIPVVRLAGLIAARPPGGFGAATLSAAGLSPVLARAFSQKRAPAVMLVINSPGGSPVQSSLIAARIRQLSEEKRVPAIAIVEDAAASGGYWLACAAEEIIADPCSILGSIGVISAGFGFQEAIARLGVERRLATAGTQKSFLDPFRAAQPQDEVRQRELLDALHEEFRAWVRMRRGAKLKGEDSALFSGRFWTGREAVALGLADGLGTLHGEVRRRFGSKAKLLPLGERRPSLLQRLIPGMAGGVAAAAAGAAALAVEERAAWARLGL